MQDYKMCFLDFFERGEYSKCKEIFAKYLKSKENIIFLQQFCNNFDNFDNFDKIKIYEIVYLFLTQENQVEDKILFEKYCNTIQYKLDNDTYNTHKINICESILEMFEILIPTYNRKDIVLQTIKEIKFVNSLIHITVIDNCSTDGTFDALKCLSRNYSNINIFQNSENIGFSRNIFECIKKSTKKYIFLISDEDPVVVKDFIEAIEYMNKNEIDWLIPINFRKKNNKLVRDRGYSFMQMITPDKYRHVAQYSGIIYNGFFLRKNLILLEKYIQDRGGMYHYLLYSVLSCIFQKGFFWPKPLVYPKNIGMRYIEKEVKDNIYFIPERWHQFRMIVKFIEELEENYSSMEQSKLFVLKNHVFNTIFSILYTSATMEYKKYIELFEKPYRITQIAKKEATVKNYQSQILQIQKINDALNETVECQNKLIESGNFELNNLKIKIERMSNFLNQLQSKNNLLYFQVKHGTAKIRIQNQLSYKLGQAMIVNSKSFLDYIRMPFVLSYIKDKHKQEQKIYQEKIKKNPSLKLPLLEDYPDYQEALKEKECLTYKLGQALIQANKTWYGGGYIKLLFEIRKLKREFKKGLK
ncbi:glycosyltransferase [Campylobacter lari]|uniref:glycosyltransferase n=1 Tax=Campylobacter lari TaxID=201 RepID=UPI002149CF09|nr:glycosyltransferase [Campylobacter lari]MCR2067451.1 glycosyltransferase [Campylobacter lari subsp. concheus]